jgi:hypothetical protein
VFAVSGAGSKLVGVVEADDLASFAIAPGANGQPGRAEIRVAE